MCIVHEFLKAPYIQCQTETQVQTEPVFNLVSCRQLLQKRVQENSGRNYGATFPEEPFPTSAVGLCSKKWDCILQTLFSLVDLNVLIKFQIFSWISLRFLLKWVVSANNILHVKQLVFYFSHFCFKSAFQCPWFKFSWKVWMQGPHLLIQTYVSHPTLWKIELRTSHLYPFASVNWSWLRCWKQLWPQLTSGFHQCSPLIHLFLSAVH